MFQKGDILMWKGNRYTQNGFLRLINALISFFQPLATEGDYVHASIGVLPDKLRVIEALPQGVVYTDLAIDNFIENEIEYYEVIGASDEDKENAVKLAIDKLHTPYDFLGLLGIGYTDYRHALYCVRLACLCYPKQLWLVFKNDKLISPNELVASGLIRKKGNLSREELPDYWKAKPIVDG
jgi:hypothetical protein